MKQPIQILLQTTIPETLDDWHIGRFSLLREFLASIKDDEGDSLLTVTVRNRQSADGLADPVLSTLDKSEFEELWLFAVDTGDGLTTADCEGITRFRQRGGGILATRDHADLGSSLCTLGGVGRAHNSINKIPIQMNPDASQMTLLRSPSPGRIIIPAKTETFKKSCRSNRFMNCCVENHPRPARSSTFPLIHTKGR